jgi:alkane 1-monooxygenase
MSAARYFIPFLFLAMAPLGFALGGAWSFLTVAALPLCLAGFDWLFGVEPGTGTTPDDMRYRMLPWLYIPLQIATTGWAAVAISRPGVTLLESVGLTLSVGLTAGIFGMLAAHEMVHSSRPAERALGLTMLASVCYMQFRIAHIYGHHIHAATREDSATARRGESAYRFVLRSVRGQLREAWNFEAARLRRRGLNAFGPSNRILQYFVVEGILVLGVACLGMRALIFFAAQSILAIVLLELFNYIAHYGLVRRALPSGGWERLGPRHSWNSSRRMNNWSLFNMGRHSDHHRFTARHYQCLEPMPDAPELPTGYAGAILLALAPPLWLRIMDPKAETWMTQPPTVNKPD